MGLCAARALVERYQEEAGKAGWRWRASGVPLDDLVDPRTGHVFYVGKGEGARCFAHVREARKTLADAKGGYLKLQTIRDVETAGSPWALGSSGTA